MPDAVPASRSVTEMTEIVLPQHANALGTVFGGQLMAWIDICGAIAAQRHCGRVAVTAAVDELVFMRPVRVGDVVCLRSRVNAAFGTSLEVEVFVEVEHPETRERRRCVQSFLTFVAIDAEGAPTEAPGLRPATADERRREAAAQRRRAARLRRRRAVETREGTHPPNDDVADPSDA